MQESGLDGARSTVRVTRTSDPAPRANVRAPAPKASTGCRVGNHRRPQRLLNCRFFCGTGRLNIRGGTHGSLAMHTGSCLCGGSASAFLGTCLPSLSATARNVDEPRAARLAQTSRSQKPLSRCRIPEQLLQSYESSPGKHRCFCRRCGSPVLARRDSVSCVVRIRAGLIKEPICSELAWHLHAASKCNWCPSTMIYLNILKPMCHLAPPNASLHPPRYGWLASPAYAHG